MTTRRSTLSITELGQRQGGLGAGAEDRGASVARGVGAAQGVDVGPGAGEGGSD